MQKKDLQAFNTKKDSLNISFKNRKGLILLIKEVISQTSKEGCFQRHQARAHLWKLRIREKCHHPNHLRKSFYINLSCQMCYARSVRSVLKKD